MRKYLAILLIFVCACIYGYSAFNTNTASPCNVSIDTAKPIDIVWPCEVSVVGDKGQKGLRIPPKVGRGWCNEAGGQASYRFYIAQDGRYHIWTYALWFDVCSNAIFAQIDDLDRAVLGNDPVYNQWHWIRGFAVDLRKGTHTLVLSNHSDHISIQKVLLTNSALSTPAQCGPVFSDIFYDGFDGCDHGNFSDWKVLSGKWTVMNPTDKACYIENALIGGSEDNAFIAYSGDGWSDYSLALAVKSVASEDKNASVSICFGLTDPNHYHQLKWHPAADKETLRMTICKTAAEESLEMGAFELPCSADQWHLVEIALSTEKVILRVDDSAPIETPLDNEITGGIGLRLEGKIDAYFDDVHVRTLDAMTKT